MNIFNYELNILTLSGIAIGVGMVIDSGVVFIEEFLSRPGPIEHTIRKTKAPILFSSATTLAVFFPLLFSKKELLIQFGGLAVAVTASILSSLIFVFIFLPPFLSALPRPKLNTGKDKSSDYLVKPLRIIYSVVSKHRYLFILLMLLLLGPAALFVPGLRAESYRRDAGNSVSLTLEFRSGAGLEHVFKTASGLEDYISSQEGVKSIGSKYEKERASFAITLNDKTDREAFIQRLKSKRQGYKDIFFYFPEESKATASFEVILIDSILRLKIKNRQNLPLELQNTAYLSEMRETGRIYHFNRQRSASFSIVTERDSRADALSAVNGMIESFPFPPGFRAEAGLREREAAGIRESALISLCLAVVLIFLILIFQFESTKTPLIVLFQIPLSFVFPVLILKIFNLPLSIPVILGLILAAGISVNNCILVFDAVKGGKISALSVYSGLKRKIKAIVIASLTTILGVLPLIFSGSAAGGILAPLSLTIATGITGSLFFLLISLPALIPGLILEDGCQQDSRQPLL
ncbi:Multidrug resistance protein MdtC [subsurface metagenome]